MDNHEATIILNCLPGIGPARVTRLLMGFGEPAAILRASAGELTAVPGIGEVLARTIAGWEKTVDLQRELGLAERAGVRILTRQDAEYPRRLTEIHDPPLCLYVRGPEGALDRLDRSLAIVGSRHTTPYGCLMAETLATAAAQAGWSVVSGLARGIDTVAHQAVVNAHGCTVAVLGSGLGRIYPQENLNLARRLVEEGGALVSEFPMAYPADKGTFPMRNRLIAGMTLGTVVVEAGLQSGSLITAGQALEQGRAVFAVPGRVDNPQARGCHALLKDGARLVESFSDVLDELLALPGFQAELRTPQRAASGSAAPAPRAAAGGAPETEPDPFAGMPFSELERRIVDWLRPRGETAIDDLVAGLNEAASKVLGALLGLELRHVVSQLPGRRATLRRTLG
ncbi:MAG: DNA-processing protein DprA [Lentisphaeria bacterium]